MVDAAKAKEGINVKDHIDYEGLKPGAYKFTGTLMKIEDGVAKPVSGVKPSSIYETVDDSGKGTATVDFGKLTRLKADTQYVVFEKAVRVNGLHIPTVKNDGTPKNPNKDDRETVKHEDSNDAAQTFVTTPEGETVPPTSTTTPPSSDKPETPGSESPTPDTDKPGKPEDNRTPGKPVPGKPVPGKPSETPDKPGAPKETTPEKPSDSTDNGKSETPGKPGESGTPPPRPRLRRITKETPVTRTARITATMVRTTVDPIMAPTVRTVRAMDPATARAAVAARVADPAAAPATESVEPWLPPVRT